MIFFGVILGIGIMAGTVFMALDKKSHLHVRIASIIAIFLMILTIIICLVVAFTDNRVPVDESVLIVGAAPEIQEKSTNVMTLVLLIILLIVMFIVIALLTIHEQRKVSQKKP